MFNYHLSTSLMGPPDLLINIGNVNFYGHSHLLSKFSEVLKFDCEGYKPDNNGIKKIIQLSEISPDLMNYILYYIYTGQLNLNEHNVLGILITCHLLRIPKIEQLCNEFLLRNHLTKFHAGFLYSQSNLNKNDSNNIIRPIANKPNLVNVAFEGPINSHVLLPSSDTTFKPPKTTQEKSKIKEYYLPIITSNDKLKKNEQDNPQTVIENGYKDNIKKVDSHCKFKTIIDIANCDGPVRFKRVLNTSYNHNSLNVLLGNKNINKNSIIAGNTLETHAKSSIKTKYTTKNIEKKCVYCNQVFKSKFCFRKHKMRHINNSTAFLTETIKKNKAIFSSKSDAKKLDKNVQYYPCKSCGIKFPSYYFVHKHRRLCHFDEEN